MAHIKIKSIKRDVVLSDEDYNWLTDRLNKWIPLMSLSWDRSDGKIFSIAVHTPVSCISIFPESYKEDVGIEYEVDYS